MVFWEDIGVRNHIIHDAQFCLLEISKSAFDEVTERAKNKPVNKPIIETIRVNNFWNKGNMGSIAGEIKIQFNIAPPTIAPTLSIKVGKEQ